MRRLAAAVLVLLAAPASADVLANPVARVALIDPVTAAHYRLLLQYLRTEELGSVYESLLEQWAQLSDAQHAAILLACGQLARRLHSVGQVHGCFYPKHIFLQATGDGYAAQLIDLEKTRPLLFGWRDRVKDLEPLLRRASAWSEADVRQLLAAYLAQPADSALVDTWLQRLTQRRREKEAR